MELKKIHLLILVAGLNLSLFGCGDNNLDSVFVATDYSLLSHWLVKSDEIEAVDVFYLYPTAWQKGEDDAYICEIDNPSMLVGAAYVFNRTATVFEPFSNIYAPYYRQADAAYSLSLPLAEHDALIGGIPTLDAVAAFDYYIKHFNNGRPFILAGHSQGSNVLVNLLTGYLKVHPDVYQRMIAAYVIGYPVTAQLIKDNPHLKFAEGPDDTGVIISYNTQAPDVDSNNNPILSGQESLVINPITWTRSETMAATNEGEGSLMPNSETLAFEPVAQYADAKINIANSVLICSTADEDYLYELVKHGFPRGVYHSFDYPFYFYNLRENAQNRINNYFAK